MSQRVGVTGSRHWPAEQAAVVEAALERTDAEIGISILIHGGASGVDTIAKEWADRNGIPTLVIRPDYERYKEKPTYAPLERNTRLVIVSDVVLAFRADGKSNGTDDCAEKAERAGKLKEKITLRGVAQWS